VIGPSVVLGAVVALFHLSLLVAVRGRLPERLPFVAAGALLGAWAGDAVGGALGDVWRVGAFSVAWSSIVCWAGIGFVSTVGELAVRPRDPAERRR
jgi:hypothetical protein